MIVAAALLAAAVSGDVAPHEGYKLCLRNHHPQAPTEASEAQWQAVWESALDECRTLREAWLAHYFQRLRGARPTADGDARAKAKAEGILRDYEAEMYERFRHPPQIEPFSHGSE